VYEGHGVEQEVAVDPKSLFSAMNCSLTYRAPSPRRRPWPTEVEVQRLKTCRGAKVAVLPERSTIAKAGGSRAICTVSAKWVSSESLKA
jgi:hypothetical protein